MEQNTDNRNGFRLPWRGIDLPLHRAALRKALKEAHHDRYLEEPRRLAWRRTRRIGIALVPAIALGVAVLLTITLLGSPISVENVMAGTEEWYSTQQTKGRWEHTVASIELTKLPYEPGGIPPEAERLIFDYETWRDTETGNTKALVKDPETGEVRETLIGLRERNEGAEVFIPSEETPGGYQAPLFTHKVYTDKSTGERSLMEVLSEYQFPMATIGPPEEKGQSDEEYEAFIEFFHGISPIEADVNRLGFLEGWVKENMDVWDFEVEEKFVPQLGKKVLVLSHLSVVSVNEASLKDGIKTGTCDLYTSICYLEPNTYDYLGTAETVTTYDIEVGENEEIPDPPYPAESKGEEYNLRQVLYREFEFTDEPVDMDTAGMRELQGWWQEL